MSAFNAGLGLPQPGQIKSIQRGTAVTVNGTLAVTIAAVNTSKAEIRNLGTANISGWCYMILVNSTTINIVASGTFGIPVSWELTERY